MQRAFDTLHSRPFQIFFFIGICLNEALNMTLKYMIREPRPATRNNYYVQFGMPSSHSQFMFFFSIYTVLFFLKR
jgi:dolichyldiphosphatase